MYGSRHSFVANEIVSASCLTLLVLALVVIPISMMGVLLAREASTAEQTIREWVSSGALHTLPEQLSTWPVIGGLLQRVSRSVLLTPDSLEQGLLSAATFLSRFFLDQVGDLLKNAFLLVTDFFLMLFALFFLFKDGKQWLASLQEVIPLDASHKQRIVDRMDQTIRAVVKGMGLTAIVQGLVAGLAYGLLGVPFPGRSDGSDGDSLRRFPSAGLHWCGARSCSISSWSVRSGKRWSCWAGASAWCR